MGRFRWLSTEQIPELLDLRRVGWALVDPEMEANAERRVAMLCAKGLDEEHWVKLVAITPLEERRRMLVGTVNSAEHRARLLAHGFGDVVGDATSLQELDARARRIVDRAAWVPRRRVLAMLELDLMAREASYRGKPLNLHPREFALLWRLADTPDEPVGKQTLAQDWRLGFMPESNSIAVQMSRLRGKLALAGLAGLVETVPGAYCLRSAMLDPTPSGRWLATPFAPTGQPRASL